ncbi:MAG TPA: ATP-dependent DNA helicase, partial [Casimicrobiaceae bacterium]|nr:ATP-dependent DNA helicase [Casimicrobiaceae bacterium]
VDGLERLLRGIECGAIGVVTRELTRPSPLALEVLAAKPYAYLDDAPLEERRTQAVLARGWTDRAGAADLGRLDADAIARVRREAWPDAANAEEVHDALLTLGFITEAEATADAGWLAWLEALAATQRATLLALPTTPARRVWVATECLPQMRALHSSARYSPDVVVPDELARRSWDHHEAIVDIVRRRLQGLGPTTAEALAEAFVIDASDVRQALVRLGGEGAILEGHFTSPAANEWCERRLLARIHRYTLGRLRAEIEPVATADFMRFLLRWQHVEPGDQREGVDALAAIIAQLQGFEAAAAAWETEILAARLEHYDLRWLDDLCLAGRIVWRRLTVPDNGGAASGPVRSTPIALMPRRSASLWTAAATSRTSALHSSRAQAVDEFLRAHGASFYDEIVDGTRLLRTQVEEALGELVALGKVTSDSFAGLRVLLMPANKRKPIGGRRRYKAHAIGLEDAGRWALIDRTRKSSDSDEPNDNDDRNETIAHALLRRYGVVFKRLLEREAETLPPWRELVAALRRLESRGDIRGGRFVAGVPGEQFALPEAVPALRKARQAERSGTLIAVSAADPLNLVGLVVPGPRVPALTQNRLLYRDGVPIAVLVGGDIQWLETLDATDTRIAENLLVRGQARLPAPAS